MKVGLDDDWPPKRKDVPWWAWVLLGLVLWGALYAAAHYHRPIPITYSPEQIVPSTNTRIDQMQPQTNVLTRK